MDSEEKRQLTALRNRLSISLDKFEGCPDRLRTWELNLANSVVFAIEDIEKIAKIKSEKEYIWMRAAKE